jgi:hypothetical protein
VTDKDILLRLIASLTLADHMGDAADDIQTALRMLGPPYDQWEWGDLDELGNHLAALGVTTIHGTSLSE